MQAFVEVFDERCLRSVQNGVLTFDVVVIVEFFKYFYVSILRYVGLDDWAVDEAELDLRAVDFAEINEAVSGINGIKFRSFLLTLRIR